MFHHQVADPCVVAQQVDLGGAAAGIDDTVRVCHAQFGGQGQCRFFGTADYPRRGNFDGFFAHDKTRIFVSSQAAKHAMADAACAGPLAKRHLCHQHRPDPVRPAFDGRGCGKRVLSLRDGGEFFFHLCQRSRVKTGADVARILQGARFIKHTQQQRTKACARALRIGEAAYDKFLALLALEFDPACGAA